MVQVTLLASLVDLAVVVAFALIAIGASAIDRRGFLASLAVGYPIILGGGWRWFVIVATFFVLGVAFTWYRYEYKKSIGSAQEKGGTRNWPNILANGGIASLLGLGELLGGGVVFSVLYVGAVSAAASDTVATELGLLNRSPPRLITDLRRSVSPGTSGGVSPMGFAGTLLASALIGVVAAVLGVASGLQPVYVVAVSVSGGVDRLGGGQRRGRDLPAEELLRGLREALGEPRALRRAHQVLLGGEVRRQPRGQRPRDGLRGPGRR